MFIRKILQSDWLDCGLWTIHTFPYRQSKPFVRLLIIVGTRVLGKMGNTLSADDREMLAMFGKLSVSFRKTEDDT